MIELKCTLSLLYKIYNIFWYVQIYIHLIFFSCGVQYNLEEDDECFTFEEKKKKEREKGKGHE